ncbi:unnamed protein product [Rotaria socialis]|uniref:Uncharacterized protein n=1 Tax=Rotaria socialis TaxID=392032 RepID=A0A818SDV1_9BILA|nr:unnamed protein product [Rotaria socialis]
MPDWPQYFGYLGGCAISLGFFSFWFCFSTTIVIVIFPSKVFDMDYVQIYDERKKSTARLLIAADNILKKDYLNIYFRGAIGIFFFDQQLNQDVYIPPDDNGNFRFNWDQDIIYKLVYSNDSRSLSMSASSSTTKSWNILTIIGSLFKSSSSTNNYKKTI